MKLAEALLLRGDMKKRLESLRGRITSNAVVQEGDTPAEDPNRLLGEAVGLVGEMEQLVFRINRANLAAKLPDGRTLTEAIARRDALAQQHSLIASAIEGAKRDPDRYGTREIKWVATVEVAKLQKQLEDVAVNIRELNARVQEANWKTELEELD